MTKPTEPPRNDTASDAEGMSWAKTLSLGALVFALVNVVIWLYLYRAPERVQLLDKALPASVAVASPKTMPLQGKNECGAYSLALALQLWSEQPIAAVACVDQVCHTVPYCEAASGAMPWAIAKVARQRGLKAESRTVMHLSSDGQRIQALKQQLNAGNALLCLIESERGHQHYVLVLGYHDKSIDIYDPNADMTATEAERAGVQSKAENQKGQEKLTQDFNGQFPGNRSLSHDEFCRRWENGGLFGVYRHWFLALRR